MLHITNGESVIHSFAAARLEGAYLSWLDVLYEGPQSDLPHAGAGQSDVQGFVPDLRLWAGAMMPPCAAPSPREMLPRLCRDHDR